jgi:CubicO group peptidase (beta-lactamase class C family)
VSKQVLAILIMQQVDAGEIALDTPADRYLPALKGAPAPTIRQLLQHRAGLRNPNDSPVDKNGNPSFYSDGATGLEWCVAGRSAPGGDWRYNNCDSIVLGAMLQRVSGTPLPALFAARIAAPLALDGTAYAGQPATALPALAGPLPPGYETSLERYGAAGGLIGTGADLLAIDRALLAGRLLSPGARDAMWAGDAKLGYMALAQWVFDAPIKGCPKPVRIVERRGAIGRYQVRNIILPDRDRIIILFTAREKQEFGEVWQGKGLAHDLLSAAACA